MSTAYNEKVDLYSFGIILFEMYCQMGSQMERNESLDMLRKEITMQDAIRKIPTEHQYIREAFSSLLNHDPCLRISLNGVRKLLPVNCFDREKRPIMLVIGRKAWIEKGTGTLESNCLYLEKWINKAKKTIILVLDFFEHNVMVIKNKCTDTLYVYVH